MQKLFAVGLALFAIATSAACYGNNGGGSALGAEGGVGGEGGVVTTHVTFNKDKQPLLQAHCQGCHVAGGIAPMPLVTYADASTFAASIKSNTASKKMPPWGAQATDVAPLPVEVPRGHGEETLARGILRVGRAALQHDLLVAPSTHAIVAICASVSVGSSFQEKRGLHE